MGVDGRILGRKKRDRKHRVVVSLVYHKETNLRSTEKGFRLCCQGILGGSGYTQGLFWDPSAAVCREGERFSSLFQGIQCGFGILRALGIQYFLAS